MAHGMSYVMAHIMVHGLVHDNYRVRFSYRQTEATYFLAVSSSPYPHQQIEMTPSSNSFMLRASAFLRFLAWHTLWENMPNFCHICQIDQKSSNTQSFYS